MIEKFTPESARTPTKSSTEWLAKQFGNLGMTAGSEACTLVGSTLIAAGTTAATIAGLPFLTALATPAIITGLATHFIGTTIGWQGAKHGHGYEKATYLLGKTLETATTMFAPAYQMIAAGFSTAATWLGMRMRK